MKHHFYDKNCNCTRCSNSHGIWKSRHIFLERHRQFMGVTENDLLKRFLYRHEGNDYITHYTPDQVITEIQERMAKR